MKSALLKTICLLVPLILAAGTLSAQAQKTSASPLSGVWVNTAYNADSAAALLVWTEEGVLKTWDQSFDARCAGESRCAVSDAWSEAGYTYVDIAVVNAFLGGVELRASHEVYRMRSDGNVLERIGVSAADLSRPVAVDTTDAMYRIWYRQRPIGLTPDQGYATLDRQM